MKWKPLQGSLRPVNPYGSEFRLLMGLFFVLFQSFYSPCRHCLLWRSSWLDQTSA